MTQTFPVLPFFRRVAEEILTPVMASHGFTAVEQDDWSVKYRRDRTKVSFAYDAMDVPRPGLLIGVGLEDPDGATLSIGLWRALPDSAGLDYSSWKFETEPELRDVLSRISEDVIPHAASVWDSEEAIIGFLAEQQIDIDNHHLETRQRVQKLAARRAFDEGRYAEARDNYVLLGGEEELSAADRRRLYLARKHLRSRNEDD
ncbi:MAG: hypothetical protein KY456_17515 [Chloroflexi bacterium]|nr:hypothetical protein [Chloroflexota bacterium]